MKTSSVLPRISFLLLTSCFTVHTYSQENADTKFFHYSAEAGIIVNSSFSHYDMKDVESFSHTSSREISARGNKTKFLPGCTIGFNLIWGRSQRANFITAISVSQTQAEYQYDNDDYFPGFNNFYSSSRIVDSLHIRAHVTYLNLDFAYRFRIFRNFYVVPSTAVNFNIITAERRSGIHEYSSHEGTQYTHEVQTIHKTVISNQRIPGLSFRLKAAYQFNGKQGKYGVFAFRNFGLKYKLPWWGLGVSCNF